MLYIVALSTGEVSSICDVISSFPFCFASLLPSSYLIIKFRDELEIDDSKLPSLTSKLVILDDVNGRDVTTWAARCVCFVLRSLENKTNPFNRIFRAVANRRFDNKNEKSDANAPQVLLEDLDLFTLSIRR
jgi:hypothetical protein